MWVIVWHGLVTLFKYYQAWGLYHPSIWWWYFHTWCWGGYRPRGLYGLVPYPLRQLAALAVDLLFPDP